MVIRYCTGWTFNPSLNKGLFKFSAIPKTSVKWESHCGRCRCHNRVIVSRMPRIKCGRHVLFTWLMSYMRNLRILFVPCVFYICNIVDFTYVKKDFIFELFVVFEVFITSNFIGYLLCFIYFGTYVFAPSSVGCYSTNRYRKICIAISSHRWVITEINVPKSMTFYFYFINWAYMVEMTSGYFAF